MDFETRSVFSNTLFNKVDLCCTSDVISLTKALYLHGDVEREGERKIEVVGLLFIETHEPVTLRHEQGALSKIYGGRSWDEDRTRL